MSRPPLGARPAVPLTGAQWRTLEVLEDYDLRPVRERLRGEGAMPAAWLDEAIWEFRRYLGLRLVAGGRVPMLSQPVDAVWHACLLFSRLYADLCEHAFGEFVHHEPATEPDPDPAGSWRRFADAYVRLYGESPGRLWRLGGSSD
ncbi:MAG TPA: hypothetical protein VK066_06800 [Chloroflexota bacterium]|nr:hypothetical protein [Chloroflexota bacterium]